MKRVLIMAAHFHPYKGGLENFALDLALGLSKNIQVDILTFNLGNNKQVEVYKGITIYRLPSKSILGNTYTLPRFNKEYKEIMKKIFSHKYNSVFTNTRFFTTSFLGMIYAKKLKAKYIHIEHGNVHVIHKNPIVTFIAWLYDQTIGRIIFSNADIVVGISEPCSLFAKKLGAKKTITIHNSINTENFRKTLSNIRKKLGIKKEDVVIINGIGRLIYAKGLQHTIPALKGMKDVVLIIIGSGPYKSELEAEAKKNGVKTIFTGNLERSEILDYLNIADIFVNPSYSEGLPTCVLEAGAAGLPIIATDVGGTREIISTPNEGILIKPKNDKVIKEKILLLIHNPQLREKLGNNIRKRIKKEFDWETNIEKFEELI